MNPTTCCQCGKRKRDILYTGTFFCEDCLEVYAEIMRMKTKGDNSWMELQEKVIELSEKGLKPKEIAEKLNITPQKVYYYRNYHKKKMLEDKDTRTDHFEKLYEKTKEELQQEKSKNDKLQKRNEELENRIKELQEQLSVAETKPRTVDDIYKQEYEREKKKHDALLQYVIALKGEIA